MLHWPLVAYLLLISAIGQATARCVAPDSYVHDLGCSLGAASFSASRACQPNLCNIHAIDSSSDMVERGQRWINTFHLPNPITIRLGLAQDTVVNHASAVIMNFTLQLIEPDERRRILDKIYAGLNPGGVFSCRKRLATHSTQAINC